MRTVSNLLNLEGRILVYLGSHNLVNLFLRNAEAEGFTYPDGKKPTEREGDDILALHKDWTINFLGWAGHMAFRHPDAVLGGPLVRVDYGKYLSGANDYFYHDDKDIRKSSIGNSITDWRE